MTVNLIILLLLLILSAFFSAAEVAFVSLTKAKIEVMIKRQLPQAQRIKALKHNPRRLLVTILIGNNVVNIAAASLATIVANDIFDSAVLGITTGVMTLLVLIFGEIIPKSYAANYTKRFAIFAAPYLRMVEIVCTPISIIFEKLTDIFAGKQREEWVSEDELRSLASTGAQQGTIEHDERAMIERLFTLNDLTAEDVMTPRSNIISIQKNLSVDAAADIISNTTHTRFPIIDKTVDRITGFVHSRDVLNAIQDDKENTLIQSLIHPILRIKKDERLDSLLRAFQRENIHMAVVTDAKDKTCGVVTLEDVLEELVGEITDEHDRP